MKVKLDMRTVLLLVKTGIHNRQYKPTMKLIDDLLDQLDKQKHVQMKYDEKEGTTIAHQPTTDVPVKDKEDHNG